MKKWIYPLTFGFLLSIPICVLAGNDAVPSNTETSPTTVDTLPSSSTAPASASPSTAGVDDAAVKSAKKEILFSGYVEASYTQQFSGRDLDAFSSYRSSESAGRSFDRYDNSLNLDAAKFAIEKPLPEENELSAGFRADAIYGSDAKWLGRLDPATGDGSIDLALEQAYVSVRAPVGNGLDLKIGKFFSLCGYESIDAPNNAQYSRGLLFSNVIPLTNTGVMANYKFNDILETDFGIVEGWNRSDILSDGVNGFGKSITGRLNITAPGNNANLSNGFIYSPDGASDASPNYSASQPVFLYDLWGNWLPRFGDDKLTLGFNVDIGVADGAEKNDLDPPLPAPESNRSSSFEGVALYTKYQFTKLFSLAGRLEYLHGDNGLQFSTIPLSGNNSTYSGAGPDIDLYSWTLTAGFHVMDNLTTRLEYRYDWSTDTIINGTDQHQIAVDVVYSF